MIIVVSKTHAATWYIGLGKKFAFDILINSSSSSFTQNTEQFTYTIIVLSVCVFVCMQKQQKQQQKGENCGNQKYSNINANVKGYVHNIFFHLIYCWKNFLTETIFS